MEAESKFQEILNQLKDIRLVVTNHSDKAPEKIPLIDPTANVLSLVTAAMQRQDDLRDSENKRIDEVRRIEERYGLQISALQGKLADAESKRIDALNSAERLRVDSVLAEQKNAVALANQKAEVTASVLRDSVSTTRQALEERVSKVEQNQYQGAGIAIQRSEGRATNQYWVGMLVTIAFGLGALLIKLISK